MRRFPATSLLLGIIAAGYIVQTTAAVTKHLNRDSLAGALFLSWLIPDVEVLQAVGGITPGTLANFSLWRLIAATCLHAGILHLLLNTWALLQVGTAFELLFGARELVTVYAIAAVTGSIFSAALVSVDVAVGASGAIFGVMGALIVLLSGGPRRHWTARFQVQLAVWAAATLLIGFMSPGIDNAAHMGGLTAGLATGLVLRGMRASSRSSRPS